MTATGAAICRKFRNLHNVTYPNAQLQTGHYSRPQNVRTFTAVSFAQQVNESREFALYVLQRSGALLASNGVAGLAWRHC
jgi:hypothetical protein